jgi:hypothetical protein
VAVALKLHEESGQQANSVLAKILSLSCRISAASKFPHVSEKDSEKHCKGYDDEHDVFFWIGIFCVSNPAKESTSRLGRQCEANARKKFNKTREEKTSRNQRLEHFRIYKQDLALETHTQTEAEETAGTTRKLGTKTPLASMAWAAIPVQIPRLLVDSSQYFSRNQ